MLKTSAREISCPHLAWKLLRGLVCLYKPPDFNPRKSVTLLRENITKDLNDLDIKQKYDKLRTEPEWQRAEKIASGGQLQKVLQKSATLATDYSSHPLVIGNGFEVNDMGIGSVNKLDHRTSGIALFVINQSKLRNFLFAQKMPSTYRISIEFGKSTDTGFIDGKVMEKSFNPYLREKHFRSALAAIQSSYQRESFKHAGISLQSQEAYELAVKGPVKPKEDAGPLIYSMKCIEFTLPNKVEIEMTVINEDMQFIMDLIMEIGFKLKICAVCSKLRCIRYGIFSLDQALLFKHVTLENVLNNIFANQAIINANHQTRDALNTWHFKKQIFLPAKSENEID